MNTIAVLPFVNRSSDPEHEYFSDGITEEIITALARIESLKVISRTSSFYFKDKNIPLTEIAEQLKVNVILEGSVRVAGNTVRISAQLIQAADDFHFWSESWDRKLENIFEIQDEISLLIAEKLREQFGHFEIADHLVKKQTESLDAYEYSLKGRYHFNKWNPTDAQKSIALFEKAIELDPQHTESYVGLADAYSFLATTEFIPRDEGWSKNVEYTHKAYSLDPENAGIHYLLANLSFFTDCNFADSFQHAVKSVNLEPSYPEAQQYMAFLYLLSGKNEKAWHHLQLSLAIDPLNQETLFYKGYYYYRTHAFEKAAAQFDDCLANNPMNIPAYIVRAYCFLMQQQYDEMLPFVTNMPKEIAIPDEQLGLRCLASILKNDEVEQEKLLSELRTAAQKPLAFQAHSYLFLAFANLKRYDEAFAWLEEALKIKSSIFLLTYSDPLVNGLIDDPRYTKFHKMLYPEVETITVSKENKSPLLDQQTADSFTEKLLLFVELESPYLNPNLSLRSLAEQVEIHPNQVSWILNEKLGKNFNEFVNHYRVEHLKNWRSIRRMRIFR